MLIYYPIIVIAQYLYNTWMDAAYIQTQNGLKYLYSVIYSKYLANDLIINLNNGWQFWINIPDNLLAILKLYNAAA